MPARPFSIARRHADDSVSSGSSRRSSTAREAAKLNALIGAEAGAGVAADRACLITSGVLLPSCGPLQPPHDIGGSHAFERFVCDGVKGNKC